VKVTYRQAASSDIVRQFRCDLIEQNLPEIASRFSDAVRHTIELLRAHPRAGARYRLSISRLQNLRSWPVAGFEVIRIYYLLDNGAIHTIRVLHGKRDLKTILDATRQPDPNR
jgi:plasmid stabilization system protein ParE